MKPKFKVIQDRERPDLVTVIIDYPNGNWYSVTGLNPSKVLRMVRQPKFSGCSLTWFNECYTIGIEPMTCKCTIL